MKKLLGIVVMCLLTCNISFADNLKIVDGDTIVLNGEKIRFSGIDTPELKQTCMQDDQEVDCGMSAKMLLVKKIGNNIPKCISEGKERHGYDLNLNNSLTQKYNQYVWMLMARYRQVVQSRKMLLALGLYKQ